MKLAYRQEGVREGSLTEILAKVHSSQVGSFGLEGTFLPRHSSALAPARLPSWVVGDRAASNTPLIP